MSEYGGSPAQIAEQWTPAQVMVMVERIRRRRALRDAEQMDLAYVVAASARGGKRGFESLQKVVKLLRREGGVRPKKFDATEFARALALRMK